MNKWWKQESEERITVYEGAPRSVRAEELYAWRKFLKYVLPWLSEKRKLGERYLAAKVAKEEAEAFRAFTEGMVNLQNAKNIAQEAGKKDGEKWASLVDTYFTQEEIDAKINEIQEKLKMLSLLHGTRISIDSTNPDIRKAMDGSADQDGAEES